MTSAPYVDLLFDPKDITGQARREVHAAAKLDSVDKALQRALLAAQVTVVHEARKLIISEKEITAGTIMKVLDYSWQIFTPRFVKISAPQIAEVYRKAFKKAKAGDVDEKYIYALAEQHARRVGLYFHETSRDAMIEGFNTYVNRKVPERAALDRALVSYGLTSRQVTGVTRNAALEAKVNSSMITRTKKKVGEYVGTSLRRRIKVFATQEEHNLTLQAEQVAWMWKVEHGKASKRTEKIWNTAKDEKVCKQCGPMHGRVVPVLDRFKMPNGAKIWVPGAHPNCRCWVRFRVPRHLEVVQKADRPYYGDDPDERDKIGRFSAKARSRTPDKDPIGGDLLDFKEPDAAAEDVVNRLLGQEVEEAPKAVDLRGGLKPIDVRAKKPVDLTPKAVDLTPKTVDLRRKPEEMIELWGKHGAVHLRGKERLADLRERRKSPVNLQAQRDSTKKVFLDIDRDLRRRMAEDQLQDEALLARHEVTPEFAYPVYRITRPDEMDWKTGRIQFSFDDNWSGNMDEVTNKAVLEIVRLKEKKKEDLKTGKRRVVLLTSVGPYEGSNFHAYLSEDDIDAVVDWVAARNLPDSSWLSEDYLKLDLSDDTGEVRLPGKPIKMQVLADKLEVHPEDFQVFVVAVARGHADGSRMGSTVYEPTDSRVHTHAVIDGPFIKYGQDFHGMGDEDEDKSDTPILFHYLQPEIPDREDIYGWKPTPADE